MQAPLFLLQPAAASATPAPATSAGAASTEHAPVPMGDERQSGETLVVTAYLVIWVLALGFVLLAWRRTRALEGRLATIEAALASAPAGPKKPRKPAAEPGEEA